MKCPKCGCKMKKEIMCPYCKVTGDDVRFASNKEAKKRIKNGDKEEVYVSSYIPYDVDKKKLLFITIFGGLFGFDAYYLGRHKRGIIQFATFILAFICFYFKQIMGYEIFTWPTDMLTLICSIFLVLWLSSIVGIFFNKASVPVVLPNKKELAERIEERNNNLKEIEEKKQAKKQAKYEKMVEKEKKNIKKK